jgi:hypothetical protein
MNNTKTHKVAIDSYINTAEKYQWNGAPKFAVCKAISDIRKMKGMPIFPFRVIKLKESSYSEVKKELNGLRAMTDAKDLFTVGETVEEAVNVASDVVNYINRTHTNNVIVLRVKGESEWN